MQMPTQGAHAYALCKILLMYKPANIPTPIQAPTQLKYTGHQQTRLITPGGKQQAVAGTRHWNNTYTLVSPAQARS
jgi:hypothetical protein